jgi:glycosyltransferase involved in cell wall biosynthesis
MSLSLPMRVVYDYQIFNWQRYGGISRYFCELASRIDTFADSEARCAAGLHINEYLATQYPQLTIGLRRKSSPLLDRLGNILNRQWSGYYLNSRPPDILHYTYYHPQPTMTSRKVAGSKKVLTVYDMMHERFQDSIPPGEDEIIGQKAAMVAAVDGIICPSESSKRDLVEFCQVDPAKITVIYHGYGLTAPNSLTPREFVVGIKPYLLVVGDRGWYKNFDRLLQAYASQPGFSQDFDLCCFGGGALTAAELATIDRLGLSRANIKWQTGNDIELLRLYQQATLFVHPSLYEGFGYPPLEAMAAGCPVACSNTSCFPETVANAAELFDPYKVEEIAQALQNVLYSTTRSAELVKLGKQNIQRFSWDRCAAEHHQVYKSLLN